MKLFWTPASPFVRKVTVTAHELGLYERLEIHPTYWPHAWGTNTIEFDPAFAAANPIGRIPALVTDEGIALAESNWICDYLASRAGRPLMPAQGPERWRSARLQALGDGALEAMIARRAESLRTRAERSENFLGKQRDRIRRCVDALDAQIEELRGQGISLPGITAAVACGYMDFRYPEDAWREGHPALAAWYEAFAQRDSMRRTMPAETPQGRS